MPQWVTSAKQIFLCPHGITEVSSLSADKGQFAGQVAGYIPCLLAFWPKGLKSDWLAARM